VYRPARVSDRSFVRFGGLSGILLAATSWLAAIVYFTAARSGQDLAGLETFQLLSALVAFWALFGIVAVHWTVRPHGEAWSFFAVLIGVSSSLGTISASLYQVAGLRAAILDPASRPPASSPTDPLSVMSFALIGLWLLIASVLLWRARFPRLLAALGIVAALAHFVGFLGALSAEESQITAARVVTGAVLVPVYWLWLGLRLRRIA
jgi:hypothetical protein